MTEIVLYHVQLEGEVQLVLGPRLLIGLSVFLVNSRGEVILATVHSTLRKNFQKSSQQTQQ